MHMIVCVKQVLDPEAPPATFKIDPVAKKVLQPPNVLWVIDPYSEFALEAALKVKDTEGGRITAIALGTNLNRRVLRKTLSLGADELILLEDEHFGEGDGWSTAYALAMAIRKINDADVIFCGRESADQSAGQVGPAIAEILAIPSVTLAQQVEILDGKAQVRRRTDSGYERIEVSLPVLVTVSHEIGGPRYETIRGVLAAKKKELIIWKPADFGVDPSQIGSAGRRTRLVRLVQPVREGRCVFVEGATAAEKGTNLALKLKNAKIL